MKILNGDCEACSPCFFVKFFRKIFKKASLVEKSSLMKRNVIE